MLRKKTAGQGVRPPKATRKQNWIFAAGAVVMILALAFVSVRNILDGYYATFVTHGPDTAAAMAVNEGLLYTTGELESLQSLQSAWDSYQNSRLRDAVSITAGDGTALTGYFFDEGSDATVVVLHRFDGSGESDFLPGPWFGSQGYNLLLPDARAHGGSGGDVTSYGYLEAADLSCWLDWLAGRGQGSRIVLYGEGMGAATAIFAAGNGALPGSVTAIVAESPYATLRELAEYTLAETYRFPAFLHFADLLNWKAGRNGAGYSLDDADVIAAAARAQTPILFLCATQDDYIPPEQTRAVYETYAGEKYLVEAPVRHGLIYAADPDGVHRALEALLRP